MTFFHGHPFRLQIYLTISREVCGRIEEQDRRPIFRSETLTLKLYKTRAKKLQKYALIKIVF